MADIGSSSISFSGLKAAYVAGGDTSASGNSSLKDGETNTSISLSFFRSALLTDGSVIPSSGQISLDTDFKGKTFGSPSKTFVTNDFNFNIAFSGELDRLYPVSSASSTDAETSSETKFAKLFHSNVSYDYPSILLCPQTGDPTIGTEDDAEVWIKVEAGGPVGKYHFQMGIIHKQGQSTWNNVASTALRTRHTAFNDRIALHTFGLITHAGHDVESSTKVDELMGVVITNETTTSNYHNRIGTTAGSGNGFTTVSSTYYYLQSDTDFYRSKTDISSAYYIGMKVNYYEITLTGYLPSYNNLIINEVKLDGSKITTSDNVYSGMYLTSDSGLIPDCVIQSITSYDSANGPTIILGDMDDGSLYDNHSGTNETVTFKAYGQRLEFQYTDHSFNLPKNLGPNHIILPRKYRTSSSGSNLDIDSWAFFVGDTTTQTNTATWSIQSSNPTNINLYKVTYDFSNQSTSTGSSTNWSPKSGTNMADWVNGTSVVNGTRWTGTKNVKGWNLSNETDGNATGSPSTGPSSGYNGSTGFMYTGVSFSRHLYVFVCRTPAFNFSTLMGDTSNDLKLKFRVHAYGSNMGDLFINISTNSTTTHSTSTNLASYTSFSGFSGHTSAWQEKVISLNSYRTVNSDHYIYFASYNANGFRGDLSVDYVEICEETPTYGA